MSKTNSTNLPYLVVAIGGAFLADTSSLPKFATLEQAVAHGENERRPFGVVLPSGAYAYLNGQATGVGP